MFVHAHWSYRRPFMNFRASFCTFSNASVLKGGMGCVNSIFKICPDKNAEGKGGEGSFQRKHHPTGFSGSADDIIFSTELGV